MNQVGGGKKWLECPCHGGLYHGSPSFCPTSSSIVKEIVERNITFRDVPGEAVFVVVRRKD